MSHNIFNLIYLKLKLLCSRIQKLEEDITAFISVELETRNKLKETHDNKTQICHDGDGDETLKNHRIKRVRSFSAPGR